MAIDLCSETSPRISFSRDFCRSDVVHPTEESHSPLDLSSDFVFCRGGSPKHRSSTADELFSDGLILPTQLHERTQMTSKQIIHRNRTPHHRRHSSASSLLPPLPLHPSTENSKKARLKDLMGSYPNERPKKDSSSFWRFRRSNSLNCDASYKVSLTCLLRSNSTGSASNPEKDRQKQMPAISMAKSAPSPPSSSSSSSSSWQQKPPLKKGYGGFHGSINGMTSSPLLGMPPPYIYKGHKQSLFGLGFMFGNGKDKKNNPKK